MGEEVGRYHKDCDNYIHADNHAQDHPHTRSLTSIYSFRLFVLYFQSCFWLIPLCASEIYPEFIMIYGMF